jgi:hypothetical protein
MSFTDEELIERQKMIRHMKRQNVEELIVDLAIHHALMYGSTPAGVMGNIIGIVAMRQEEWQEMATEFRETLRITEP